jgi:hypothetical protein
MFRAVACAWHGIVDQPRTCGARAVFQRRLIRGGKTTDAQHPVGLQKNNGIVSGQWTLTNRALNRQTMSLLCHKCMKFMDLREILRHHIIVRCLFVTSHEVKHKI